MITVRTLRFASLICGFLCFITFASGQNEAYFDDGRNHLSNSIKLSLTSHYYGEFAIMYERMVAEYVSVEGAFSATYTTVDRKFQTFENTVAYPFESSSSFWAEVRKYHVFGKVFTSNGYENNEGFYLGLRLRHRSYNLIGDDEIPSGEWKANEIGFISGFQLFLVSNLALDLEQCFGISSFTQFPDGYVPFPQSEYIYHVNLKLGIHF